MRIEKDYPNAIYEGETGATSAVLDISGCNKLVIQLKRTNIADVTIDLKTSLSDVNHGFFEQIPPSNNSSVDYETFMIDCVAETLVVKLVAVSTDKATVSVKAIGD